MLVASTDEHADLGSGSGQQPLCARWGMRVEEAGSADDALRKAAVAAREGDPYRVFLLDRNLPGTGGDILARRLREDPENGGCAIVLVASTDEHADLGSGSGQQPFDERLLKPVREAVLRRAVERSVARRAIPGAMAANGDRPAAPVALPVSPALPHSGRRILLVEDNGINVKVGTALLQKLGCRVDVATNGREALEMSARHPYDLIFMDCQMPVMDGFEATAEIRRREEPGTRTPIVALTAAALAEDQARCVSSGMDDYISKPVRSHAISAALARWLRPPDR